MVGGWAQQDIAARFGVISETSEVISFVLSMFLAAGYRQGW